MNQIMKIIILAILFILVDYFYLSSVSSYFNDQVKLVQGSKIKMRLEGAILCYILLGQLQYSMSLR